MAGLEMGAHQYGCAVYQLPRAHPQMEKAESVWLGMPRHSNTACRLPENEKSSLHIGKPKCRLLFWAAAWPFLFCANNRGCSGRLKIRN